MKPGIIHICSVLFSLILLAHHAQGQREISEKTQKMYCSARLQAILGPGLGWTGSDEERDYMESKTKMLPVVTLGFLVPVQLSENTAFRPGLVFETKGGKSESTYQVPEYEIPGERRAAISSANGINSQSVRKYISLPLLFNIAPFPGLKEFSFIPGLTPGFLLSEKSKTNAFGHETQEKGTENMKKVDLDLVLGVGYDLTKRIGVNLVYNHGLLDTYKGDYTSKNRSIRLLLSYKLKFNPLFKESYSSKRKNLRFSE
ncbi:porin family protein [Flexithrix dorotheae]|uniref:porin family protein n=1 Tax=Flexithrix dorotheae TaxID=70993 RepID=UPI00036CEA9C|nr:porin family protein [Flexithrix dorotheae]